MKKGSRQLYRKMLLVYSGILVAVVLLLLLYFITASGQQSLQTNREYMSLMSKEARDYLKQCSDNTDHILNSLYSSYEELNDLCHYFEDDVETYMRYRLDTYDRSPLTSYTGIEDYVFNQFEVYGYLETVQLYGYQQSVLTTYQADGTSSRRKITGGANRKGYAGTDEMKGRLVFWKEIRDPVSLLPIGWMAAAYGTGRLKTIGDSYEAENMLVYTGEGEKIYFSKDGALPEDLPDGIKELEEKLNAYVLEEDVGVYRILTYVPRRQARHIAPLRFFSIVGVGALILVFGEMGILLYLSGVMRRLKLVVEGMDKVTTGDLNVRIECGGKGDELDIIAGHFNDMCHNLDTYIKKSYLSEIEQKNAEMAALQSQINPHFLYNTLEAIRMKAICNGDREVGKMLYSMAALFQSQLKEADVITLGQELHYCKKYMELFEYRYRDKFQWQIECEEKFLEVPIIKFVLQPILENYFSHGIRLEGNDNLVDIRVRRDASFMLLIVEDNGRGMDEEEIAKKNEQMSSGLVDPHQSMGLANVNRRLKAVYGDVCGLTLSKSVWKGLKVTVRFWRKDEDTKEEEMQ